MTMVPGSGAGPMEPQRAREGTLLQVVETLLDKGLVVNADIMVSVAGVELLGIRIRAALASFDTAARYGLEFPGGTDRDTLAWKQAIEPKETCPECGKSAPTAQLLEEYCPWCGWQSALAQRGSASGREVESEASRVGTGAGDEADDGGGSEGRSKGGRGG
ncbi:gas vesicle protein [Krasilnikoviella flava]|uniref:Gas vesicle protein n=1 Tax=Krasilnikoviella flava TaxID=526729 RepID=A0A1T5L9J2_9MICO|nr:gas vesicle protein [Krasilnikoviella flava]SKC72068.1 Gas vesicle protein [Krasilnikoviella flava]